MSFEPPMHTPNHDMMGGAPDKKTCDTAMLAHLASFAAFVFPFGNILGPVLVWLAKRDESPFIAEHARRQINFQITLMAAAFVSAILSIVLIGFLGLIAVMCAGVYFPIMAAMAAQKGADVRVPVLARRGQVSDRAGARSADF